MEKIEALIKADKLDEALELCLLKIKENAVDVDALLCCGKIYQRKADSRNAMNYFMKVLAIDPKNKVAQVSRDMIKGINDYFCKDMINP